MVLMLGGSIGLEPKALTLPDVLARWMGYQCNAYNCNAYADVWILAWKVRTLTRMGQFNRWPVILGLYNDYYIGNPINQTFIKFGTILVNICWLPWYISCFQICLGFAFYGWRKKIILTLTKALPFKILTNSRIYWSTCIWRQDIRQYIKGEKRVWNWLACQLLTD